MLSRLKAPMPRDFSLTNIEISFIVDGMCSLVLFLELDGRAGGIVTALQCEVAYDISAFSNDGTCLCRCDLYLQLGELHGELLSELHVISLPLCHKIC